MDAHLLRQIRIERYIFGALLAFVMVFIAELSGEKEIIFPEICALTIGAWISEKQPWMTNKRRIFFLMTISSLFGVLIVRYVPLPLIFQVCLCFGFTGFILTLLKTNFIPIISACILPVYLGTKSWVYPLSVAVMALIIIVAQWYMEKFHMRPVNKFIPVKFSLKKQIIKWSKLLLVFGFIALMPFKVHQIYFLAPPLIVMFTELSNPKSKVRKKIWHIITLMFFSALIGCILRLLLNIYLGLPLFICTLSSCVILFIATSKVKISFPPAGAILLIPMILDKNLLLMFPFEVLAGAITLGFTALIMFKDEEIF